MLAFSGDPYFGFSQNQRLLSNKIQVGEDIGLFLGSKPQPPVPNDGGEQTTLNSDGNRAIFGNADSDGANVNSNWDRNVNSDIGLVCSRARQLSL